MVTLVNRAKMSTSTTGTGTITLGSAEDGYQSFADAGVTNGDVVRYVIEDGDDWEIGSGTYTATGTTLTRTVDESSNSDAALNLTGSAVMFVTSLAEDIVNSYTEKTANYTAKSGEKILANTSGGAWTLTLPPNPWGGDRIVVADHDDWSTNNLTVARNGKNIEGDAEDMTLDIGGALVEFVYDNAQWQVYAQVGAGVEGGDAEYEKVGTISSSTLDLETGNVFSHAPSANVTYVFSNPPTSGTAYGFTLKVTPSATVTVTWPSSVDWAGGTAPDAPASGETDVYVFYTQDGGTTYYGFQAGDAMA
jgi:hypothetical protein